MNTNKIFASGIVKSVDNDNKKFDIQLEQQKKGKIEHFVITCDKSKFIDKEEETIFLKEGKKVSIAGRLITKTLVVNGKNKYTTEILIEDMNI